MKPNITIDSVSVTINGHKIEMTIEQARELRDILNAAFPLGAPFTPPQWPVLIPTDPTPYPYPLQPLWPHWQLPEVICQANSATLALATL